MAGGVVGDELGEVLQQVGWPTGVMLAAEAAVFQVADGSMEPGPVASMTTVALPSTNSATVTR